MLSLIELVTPVTLTALALIFYILIHRKHDHNGKDGTDTNRTHHR